MSSRPGLRRRGIDLRAMMDHTLVVAEILERLSNNAWFFTVDFLSYALVLAGLSFLIKRSRRTDLAAVHLTAVKVFLTVFFGAALGVYLFLAVTYPFILRSFDDVESSYAVLAWYYWEGHPLYPTPATQERYAVIFGPNAFIIISFFEAMFGPSFFSAKLPCALSGLTSLGLLFLGLRRTCSGPKSIFLTGLSASLLIFAYRKSYGIYPDAFVFLALSAAVYFFRQNRSSSPILIGLCLGFAENVKIDCVLYFLPIYVWAFLDQQWRGRDYLWSLLGGMVIYALPFVVFRQVSFFGYLSIFQSHALTLELPQFIVSLEEGVFLLFPFLFLLLLRWLLPGTIIYTGKAELAKMAPLFLAGLLLLAPASRTGAGSYHFLPLIPSFAYLLAQYRLAFLGELSPKHVLLYALFLSWVTSLSVGTLAQVMAVEQYFVSDRGSLETAYLEDVRSIVAEHPGWSILMGGSSTVAYPTTFYRYELIFQGMPMGIDPVSLAFIRKKGENNIDLDALVAELQARDHRPVMWICAKGQEPFSMHSYLSTELLYPKPFRKRFFEKYVYERSSRFYDLYVPR
jgi:hypothetical protein